MIPTLAMAFLTGEAAKASEMGIYANWADPKVLILLVLSGAIGLGIGYYGFACQKVISATSFLVLQNISKVAVVSAGIVVFQDPIRSPLAVAGLLLSLGGSYLYGKSQMDLAAEQPRESGLKGARSER